ncbi:MAG: DMT family transporter [Cyclobacteriaceae bacterium]
MKNQGNSPLWVHPVLLIVGLIYGGNYVVAKLATPEFIPPFAFIVLRVFFASVIFVIIGFFGVKERIRKADVPRLLLCALFGASLNQILFFKGLTLTSAISSSIIMTANPVIVLVFSAILLRERITWIKTLGIAVGLAGALLLVARNGFDFSNGSFIGDLLVLGNATSYGIYLVLVKPLMHKYHPMTIMKWAFLLANIVVIPVGWSQLMTIDWWVLPPIAWYSILYVVLGTTVLAYILNALALKHVNPSLVGTYIYVQPVFATAISMIFLNETPTWPMFFATLLIFTGVYFVSRPAAIKTLKAEAGE